MELTYIYHSSFAIESEQFIILIDYYQDTLNKKDGWVHNELLKKEKKLYVLSSHSHADHFNKEVLEWRNQHSDIIYIFSTDILEEGLASKHDAYYLSKGDEYQDEYIHIKAFGSTDIGISFYIQTQDKTIFHTGDLNNWHWREESTQEESDEYEEAYLKELKDIKEFIGYLDVLMFPIDPRLGKDYMLGAEQFISAIPVKLFAPMHFGNRYQKANAFEEYAKEKNVAFFQIQERGDKIEF